MFEIFLFINPIGIYCYDIEKRIQDTIQELDLNNVSYHLVPITNVDIVQADIIRRSRDNQKVCDLSAYTLTASLALEDYHAIRIAYGNKKARNFIFTVQQKLSDGTMKFSPQILDKVMKEQKLNLKQIRKLRTSDYIKDAIHEDQVLAQKWDIKKTPTTIVFDEEQISDSGVMVEGLAKREEIVSLFLPSYNQNEVNSTSPITTTHLRLL